MSKGGLLPSPIIIPLSSKNQIHSQTFIEIRSDVSNVRIYFTVDGSKPDPFQVLRVNSSSTNLYQGAFRLGTGRRVIKAIVVTSDGSRESQVTTKYLEVNDDYSDDEQYQPNSTHDFDRSVWNNAFNNEQSISPGVSITPREYWIQPTREQIPEYIPPPPPRVIEVVREDDNFWDRKTKPLSPGNGNWKKTLEHLFLNLYNFVKNEQELRELFGWKKFGRIETARLIDKGGTYQVLTTFKKPLGEQTSYEEPSAPTRKPHSKHRSKKRSRPPPSDVEEEKPIRRAPVIPTLEEEEEEQEKHPPKIYTEDIEEEGTLVSFPDFNADRDCDHLRKAIKGSEIDGDTIIDILGNRTADQRSKIRERYKTMTKRDFDADLKKDTSGDFRQILKALFYSPVEYDCHELRRATKALGTNEEILIEILMTRSNKRLQAINTLYPKLFNQTLEEDILSDTNGHLKRILSALIHNQRSDSNEINESDAKKDAKSLYEAGEKRWATDESKFIQILCKRSDVQLKAVFEAYGHLSEYDIEAAIKSETSGNLRKGLLAIVRLTRNRPGYFAHRLKNALKGASTDEAELNRVIISRCEIDMVQIKREYEKVMKCSLEQHIESDTHDDYQRMLLELIKDPANRTQKTERSSRDSSPRSRRIEPNDEQEENNNRTQKTERSSRDSSQRSRRSESNDEQEKNYREETVHKGTMIAAPNFDANRDADALRKAMKGAGTKEQVLIDILGNRDTSQRLEIKSAFASKHNRDLVADLKSETSGQFGKLLERLMLDPVELDCFELKQAIQGAGTDEEALIEILASRSNERIRSINETYRKMYSKSLDKDVRSDTSGDFRRLLVSLMQGQRPETTRINAEQVKKDAQSLMDAGAEKFGGNEPKFNTLLCQRTDAQLKATFDKFAELAGKSIEDLAKKETSGDHQRAILAILRCIQSRPHFFAQQLRNAMKGAGTKESTLNRVIVTRSEIDLLDIKSAYKNLHNRELERDVNSDTSGDYRTLLLQILKDPSQRK